MAETRVINLEVRDNANDVQKEFENLRKQIAKTTDEVEQLSQAYGENSQEADEARRKLSQLTQAYDQLSQSATDTGASFEQVYGELQPLTTRMGEAEDRLYELALAGKTNTQEYKDLLVAVSNYRKAQIQTDMVVDAASTTMSTKVLNAVNGVANAYSVAEGAAALMGIESEKLQETMVKLQAAMAISQGLAGLNEAKTAFVSLGSAALDALKAIRVGLLATGIGVFIVALGTIVAYWDDIKEAVSGVSEEQRNLNALAEKKFETAKEELSTLDAQDNILKLQGKSEREILQMKIKKIDAAIELGKIELKNVLATSKAEEKAAIQNYNLTKSIVDFILDTALFLPKLMLMPIDLAIKGANKISEALGLGKAIAFDVNKTIEDMKNSASGFIAGSLFNVPEIKKENEKAYKEIEKSLIELENQKAGHILSLKEIDKAGSQSAIDAKKAELDALIELEIKKANTDEKTLKDLLDKRLALEKLKGSQLELAQKNNAEKLQAALDEDIAAELAARNEANKNKIAAENEYLDQIEQLQEQNIQRMMTEEELEISAVNEKYYALEEAAKNNADELAVIEQAKANELNDINLKYQQIKYDADKAAADAELELRKRNRDFAIESAVSMMSTITELAAQSQEKYAALNQAVLDNDKLTDSEKQKLIDANNKKAKKAFDIQKAANIASALITTYQSATSAYASQFVPVPDPSSPIRGGIAAGLAVAAGLANVKRIASQKFEGASLSGGSSSGGGSVPDAGTMQAPNFSVIGSSGVNQLAQLQQQPTKAYVVSGEVTSQQALDRNRVQNATL